MQMTRTALLAGGAALLLAPAAAADVFGDNDLAWLRLLVGTELLGADFYASALAARKLKAKQLDDALAAEKQHYQLLAGLLTGSNATPATANDVDFTYPTGTFSSPGAIAKLAVALETTFLGAYLGAVDGVQSAALKLPLARIGASQAQHLALFRELLGGYPLRPALPAPLAIDQASNLLDRYTA
jgi:hypothetical protein